MSYNMYDKNYGSGFGPENDNRPTEQKSVNQQPVNGEYRFSYGFQAEEPENPTTEPTYTYNNTTPPPTQPPHTPPTPSEPPKKSRKKKSGSSAGKIAAIVLAAVLVCSLAGAGGAYLMNNALNGDQPAGDTEDALPEEAGSTAGEEPSPQVQVSDRDYEISTATVEAGEAMDPSQIYNAYAGSVVSIEVQTSSGIGAGTGFVITADGYVLTCYHVIDGYQAISCTFADTTSYEAEYVGGDADADLAVLKIVSDTAFKPMVIGDSDQLSVGSTVTTIGNALGTFANTLTSGRVSGLDRALTMSDGTVMNVLQTDCTVNSGNSGGPLFNEYGEVIGVVNAKYSSSGYTTEATIEGIGFAIPINDAMAILDDLIEHGYITGKPYLGISVSTVSSITAQQYSNMVVGAYVRSVEEGSCSEKAGLQVGDIITQVNGADITTYEELIDAKNALRAGDQMTVTVFRESTYITLVITLDEEVPESAAGSTEEEQQQQDNYYGYSYGDGSGNGYSYGYGYFDPYSFFGRGW